jgi:hypothetical protein
MTKEPGLKQSKEGVRQTKDIGKTPFHWPKATLEAHNVPRNKKTEAVS